MSIFVMFLDMDVFNLHIKAGETLAIVGPSGGGRTTLGKSFLHFYDPSSGEVLAFFIFNLQT